MFDLSLTEEQIAVRKAVQAFGDQRVRAALEPGELTTATAEPLLSELHAMGLLAPSDSEDGGQGLPDPVTLFFAVEELATADPGLGYALAHSASAAVLLAALGDPVQRAALSSLSGAVPRVSLQLAEGYGRRPSEYHTRASAVPGGWQLSGQKIAALWPGTADLTVVVARVEGTGELAVFAFDAATAVPAVLRDDLDIGRLGLRAAHTGTVSYQSVLLPARARLGGTALETARALARARVTIAAVALGTARSALAYALRYAGERQAFGQPIGSYQSVSFPLTDIEMNRQAVRLRALDTLAALDGLDDADEIEWHASRTVNRALGLAAEATRVAVNTLGGHGYLEDHPCERWYRDASMLAAIDIDPVDAPLLLA